MTELDCRDGRQGHVDLKLPERTTTLSLSR
jgi:hypothetical protein